MMYPQKRYANCSIQTDSSNQSPSLSESNSPVDHSCVITGSNVSSDITLANASAIFESAYNQSPDSQNNESPALLSSRYCIDRNMGILYNRPSESRLSAKRVLSLTSVSPTGKFKTIILKDKLRLVSMPERGKYANVSAKGSLLEKRRIDDLDDTSNHEQAERPYPTDLPQTPSPPSSPESITIIGSNARVPGSFLRRPGYADSDGWVSWGNSPPRPIPALHGPSSLPYARCPSGAEGTLVEGDDLSHKIWGLGIDDSQMVHHPATSRPSVRQASQPQEHHPIQSSHAMIPMNQDEFALSHYYERDSVIDLSQPATFYGHVGTQRVLSKKNIEHTQSVLPISTSGRTTMPHLASIENFAASQAKNIELKEAYKTRQSSALAVGLGLHTWSSRGPRLEIVNPMCKGSSNSLNKAAPIFVPASANIREKQYHTPHSAKPLPCTFSFSAPRQPLVFNDDAEQHQQPDTQNLLPTPPSTSSPCWTPVFSRQPEMAISKSMISTLNPKVSIAGSYSPNIYSPMSDLEDDHIKAITQQNAIQEGDVVYDSEIVPRMLKFQGGPFTFQTHPENLDSPQVDDVPLLCLKTISSSLHEPYMAFSINYENSPSDGNLLQAEPPQVSVGTQGSTERRRNLSYQQPRSIPLARLIQRRLSSVAEEDLSTRILSPFLEEAQTERFTRSKGLSLEPLDRQIPRIGLLDEEIFTAEIFSVRTEGDHQLIYEAESRLNSGESNVVVKLPQKASVLRRVDGNRKREILCNKEATLNTRHTNSDPGKRHKIRVNKRSTATIVTDDT